MSSEQRPQPLLPSSTSPALVPTDRPGGSLQAQTLPLTYYPVAPVLQDPDQGPLLWIGQILRRRVRVIAGVTIAVTAVSWLWTLLLPSIYQGELKILVEELGTTPSHRNGQRQGKTPAQASPVTDDLTPIEVLEGRSFLEPIAQQLQPKFPRLDVSQLADSLNVTRLGYTKVLQVTYIDSDRALIQAVLDRLSDAYQRYSLQQHQKSLQQGEQFVDAKLPRLRSRIVVLEKAMEEFRKRYGVLSPEEQGRELAQRLSNIQQQRQQTGSELAEAQSYYTNLQRQSGYEPSQALATAVLNQSARYQQLLNQIQDVDTKLAQLSAVFRDDSPQIRQIREQRRNLVNLQQREARRLLGAKAKPIDRVAAMPVEMARQLVNAANRFQSLQMRDKALAANETQLKQELSQIPTAVRRYTDLQREIAVATESLNRFVSSQEKLQLDKAQKGGSWKVISAPLVDSQPISPDRPRNFLWGAIAGLVLGVGAGLLRESLDRVFHSAEELAKGVNLPLLGVIPYNQELQPLSDRPNPLRALPMTKYWLPEATMAMAEPSVSGYRMSPFLEAFRLLHTQLRFLGSDAPIRSVAISSATAAEGKSTITLQLAQAATALGQRVLLVDADLRCPELHDHLQIANLQGLSNLLSSDISPEQAIHGVDQRLFVLTAGQLPPDPTQLLSSEHLPKLIQQFQEQFDLVIYDTPPLLGLADALLLSAYLDGVVLVVGLGAANRAAVRRAVDTLKFSKIALLGIVANDMASPL